MEFTEPNGNVQEYFLVKVPKNIDIKELHGASIDIRTCGPSKNIIYSKKDENICYGYDLVSLNTNTFNKLTRLDMDNSNIQIDSKFMLKGCLNFYVHSLNTNSKIKPLVPISPNDSIEDIVRRTRGHSGKKKLLKEKKAKESDKKKAKFKL